MDLRIETKKIKEFEYHDLEIYNHYIEYDIERKNIDIIAIQIYSNQYTFDLVNYWYADYDKSKSNVVIFKQREYEDYDAGELKCYVVPRECEGGILGRATTHWGDADNANMDIKHIYKKGNEYTITSDGFIDTKTYSYLGKNVKSIGRIRSDIVDGSWLFAEMYYAEDEKFFPFLDTVLIDDMSYMFFHCPRIKTLNLSHYVTDKVCDVRHMFDSCISLEILDIRNFDLKNVRDRFTDNMLLNCVNLKEIHLDNCDRETIRKITESKNFPIDKTASDTDFSLDVFDYERNEQNRINLLLLDKIIEYDKPYNLIVDDKYATYIREEQNLHIKSMQSVPEILRLQRNRMMPN